MKKFTLISLLMLICCTMAKAELLDRKPKGNSYEPLSVLAFIILLIRNRKSDSKPQ